MDFKAYDTGDLHAEIVSLRSAVATHEVVLAEKDEAIANRDAILAELAKKLRLTQAELDYLKRRLYGRSSEKSPEGPGLFDALGEPEPTPPAETAPDDEASTLSEREIAQAKKRPTGRKPLPANLPRKEIEHPLDPSELACDACGKDRVRIGEERSELVQYVPASYVVEVHVRGKYACRCGEGGVVTPPAPPRPIPGSYAGPGLLAQVIVSKFDDHLPLYRQAEIFRRAEFDIPRSTLCDWIGGVMPLLAPVALAVRSEVLTTSYVQADETPVSVRDGPKGKMKQAYFWAYRSPELGSVFFDFRMGRSGEGPCDVLRDFKGTLQTDAYVGYDKVVKDRELVTAGCLTHARRRFVDAFPTSPKEAGLVLAVMLRLYTIEERIKGQSVAERLAVRQRDSQLQMDTLKDLIDTLAKTALPSSVLGDACSYAQNQWEHLTAFMRDGRVEIDQNAIERTIRGIAMGRRAWLFCGNEEGGRRAAILYTLVESCKAAKVEPFAYFTDLLTRLPSATDSQIASFTPRAWAASRGA